MQSLTRRLVCLTFVAAATLIVASCEQVRTPGIERFAPHGEPQPNIREQSAKAGINAAYLGTAVDIDLWTRRFEAETREIYHARREITAAVELHPGERIADIGAGTGVFLEPFAEAVGETGTVYALDISPAFVAHMSERAKHNGLTQVEARLCTDRSIELPADSIDKAFVCDVYHHFEYPQASLASIYEALTPGGKLVIIDFLRLPGVSREWVLNHVRIDKEGVLTEIEEAGFVFEEEVQIDQFKESYFLLFRKPVQ